MGGRWASGRWGEVARRVPSAVCAYRCGGCHVWGHQVDNMIVVAADSDVIVIIMIAVVVFVAAADG